MPLPPTVVYSDAAVCMADDQHVAFYASKTLKKFRVQHFTDYRVVGMWVEANRRIGRSTGKALQGSVLHLVDARANYVQVDLETFVVLRAATIQLTSSSNTAASLPLVRQACFYTVSATHSEGFESSETLRCSLLCDTAVYDVAFGATAAASLRYAFERPTADAIMAVGERSGFAVVGQSGQRWLVALPSPMQRAAAAGQHTRVALSAALHSVACHPEEPSVAVGGSRGELCVYPSVFSQRSCFAEHWHHTPLLSLAFSADGAALYSGASEGVLLLWNLSSFTFKKIGVHVGPIAGIVVHRTRGTQLLLPCSHASLVAVDLLKQTVEKSLEAAQWTSSGTCSGLLVTRWMGQDAVVLTGLPDVVRVCDALTQQALYSLHVATQLETAQVPAGVGVRHVGILDDGRVLVTVEEFRATSLTSALRFWVFDGTLGRHVEAQRIYQPHSSAIVALEVDAAHRRVFTMSSGSIKCWAEAADVEAADATAAALGGAKRWHCTGTTDTPSSDVSALTISPCGTVAFVASDVVHVMGVGSIRSGVSWPLIAVLTQDASLEPLHDVCFDASSCTVSARNRNAAFVWSVESGALITVIATPNVSTIAACCRRGASKDQSNADGTVVVVFADGSAKEVALESGSVVATAAPGAFRRTTRFLRWLGAARYALVDQVDGYRTVDVQLDSATAAAIDVTEFVADAASSSGRGVSSASRPLQRFFRTAAHTPEEDAAQEAASKLEWTVQASEARNWLQSVLSGSLYAAPPSTSILTAYLKNVSIDSSRGDDPIR